MHFSLPELCTNCYVALLNQNNHNTIHKHFLFSNTQLKFQTKILPAKWFIILNIWRMAARQKWASSNRWTLKEKSVSPQGSFGLMLFHGLMGHWIRSIQYVCITIHHVSILLTVSSAKCTILKTSLTIVNTRTTQILPLQLEQTMSL